MSDSVDRVFVHALNTVKRIPRTGSARPPLPERLKLYGLYKQSMEGDVEGVMDRPEDDGTSLQAEREKWDAWYMQRHLSRTEAKRQYITTLLDTMHKYASSTLEARELISELEFVWDQIKSNTTSSSSSSPVHVSNIPPPHIPSRSNYGSQYGSIGGRISRAEAEDMERPPPHTGRDSRLRVLSPVSQPDVDMPSGRRVYDPPAEQERGEDEGEEDDEEEDEEDFQEARNSPFEDDDDDDDESDNNNNNKDGEGAAGRRPDRDRDIQNRRWRRRVEQAITKMTAEVAAMREQMETRALNSRRRASLWAWLKWLVWVTIRQVCWDLAILGCVLVWLRVVRGDRRLEFKIRGLRVWGEVRRKVLVLRRYVRGGLVRGVWLP
ncbi:hypothetical protein AJ79_08377 [Helicocarpus griseus UAMH5409]|uniref:ACB domain-containing protein n=1 Tax=Helicocarpus griseus UAMH5409 TaxID=1447875 RepID=A0A2B7WSX0_9EURO|nr:hypothetical protein AJ79_08377 [Helicocarpus griseus UAMH5409]